MGAAKSTLTIFQVKDEAKQSDGSQIPPFMNKLSIVSTDAIF